MREVRQGSGGGSSSSSSIAKFCTYIICIVDDLHQFFISQALDHLPVLLMMVDHLLRHLEKRKDGLLKRGLKKVVRGISKGVSAAAGAVKAGADSLTDRARKEDMNYNKELATIKELYSQVCDHQSEEEIEEGMKPLPKEKMERQSNKAYAKEVVAARQGNEKETNKQMQRRIAMKDPAGRKAALKKEEYIDEMGKSDQGVRDRIAMFKNSKIEYTPPTNWDKDANRGKGATVSPKQAEKRRRKSLRQEELEATGLFTAKEIEALVESEMRGSDSSATLQMGRRTKDTYNKARGAVIAANELRKDIKSLKGNKTAKEEFTHEANVDEAMSSYDRNRKRAAQRAADRNAARAAGKTGVVPGVGYVTPNKERETYTDEKGTVRHKSGAKNE